MYTNWLIEHIENDKEYAALQLETCSSWQYIATEIKFGNGMLLLPYRKILDANVRELIEFPDGNGFRVSTINDAADGDSYFFIAANKLCKEYLKWML